LPPSRLLLQLTIKATLKAGFGVCRLGSHSGKAFGSITAYPL